MQEARVLFPDIDLWLQEKFTPIAPDEVTRLKLRGPSRASIYYWLNSPVLATMITFSDTFVVWGTYYQIGATPEQWLWRHGASTQANLETFARAKVRAGTMSPQTPLYLVAFDLVLFHTSRRKPVVYDYLRYDKLPPGVQRLLTPG